MRRLRLRHLILLVAVLAVSAGASAWAAGGPPGPGAPAMSLTPGQAGGDAPTPTGTYTDLIRASHDGTLRSVTVDAQSWKAQVLLDDGRVMEVVVPPDNGTLLRTLADDGVAVEVEGSPAGGGGNVLTA